MSKIVSVSSVLDSPSALTQEQGEKIYQLVSDSISSKQKIVLDFDGIESMISPFLNNAIGKLYGSYPSETIKEYLSLTNFPTVKQSTLTIVIENAKKFYQNKAAYASTVKDVIG